MQMPSLTELPYQPTDSHTANWDTSDQSMESHTPDRDIRTPSPTASSELQDIPTESHTPDRDRFDIEIANNKSKY